MFVFLGEGGVIQIMIYYSIVGYRRKNTFMECKV